MKKRVFLAAILSLAMCYNSTYAFDGPTHTYVTVKALEIFEKAHGTKFNEIFTPENKAIIVEYSVMPDKDETDDAYSQHFFNLMTQKNFKGTDDSALTKLCTHFYRAVGFYRAGNVKMAMQELGRALHFEEDLSTPVHSNTISTLDAGKTEHEEQSHNPIKWKVTGWHDVHSSETQKVVTLQLNAWHASHGVFSTVFKDMDNSHANIECTPDGEIKLYILPGKFFKE